MAQLHSSLCRTVGRLRCVAWPILRVTSGGGVDCLPACVACMASKVNCLWLRETVCLENSRAEDGRRPAKHEALHACWWLLVPGWITLVFAFEQALVLFPYGSSGLVTNEVLDSIFGCSDAVSVGGSEAKRYARRRRFWGLWRQPVCSLMSKLIHWHVL